MISFIGFSCGSIHNDHMREKHNLVFIQNGTIKVGILTDVGGRIVYASLIGEKNILKSDSELWVENAKEKPEVSARSHFKAYNGHIVWVGPQKEWWSHQNKNLYRKYSKANWPPDPYLTIGDYNIINQTDTSISMISPESPVSGLQLTKEIKIDSKGKIFFRCIAKNILKTDVSWDLWFNTRLDGFSRFYVPASSQSIKQINKGFNKKSDTLDYTVKDDFFTFIPEKPTGGKTDRWAKAYLFPISPYIAAFSEEQLLLIHFESHVPSEIHHDQSEVEIFNSITTNNQDALLELEYHAPYKTLKPGETMEAWENWDIRSYHEVLNDTACIQFIKKN